MKKILLSAAIYLALSAVANATTCPPTQAITYSEKGYYTLDSAYSSQGWFLENVNQPKGELAFNNVILFGDKFKPLWGAQCSYLIDNQHAALYATNNSPFVLDVNKLQGFDKVYDDLYNCQFNSKSEAQCQW